MMMKKKKQHLPMNFESNCDLINKNDFTRLCAMCQHIFVGGFC